jgi:hypothetical protein
MKRYLIAAAMLLALTGAAFTQIKATVKSITGKVEIMPSGGAWQTARVGMKMDKGAFISTGFSSTAVLDIGSSVLTVSALTRMQLAELVARQDSVSTELYLRVGKVRAEVKAVEGVRQDFVLRSPQSTAAVRGTEFEFDGVTVTVVNGVVTFSNTIGQSRGVSAGEESFVSGDDVPTAGDAQRDVQTSVDPYTAPPDVDIPQPPPSSPPLPATVIIRWQ